jgi:hypothetical protein
MRPVSLVFICLSFALCSGHAQEAPKPGAVSGRVVNGLTGEPVRKAVVTLTMQRTTVQGTTGSDGGFRILQVRPGEYRVSAARTGFLRGSYQAPVKVEAGQTMSGIEIRMNPQSVVAGKVVDEDGDPVERAMVSLVSARGAMARRGQLQAGTTNDLGEFRLAGVPPGRYYLLVRREGTFVTPGSTQEYGYPPTYYPSTREESSAAPVVLAAGRDAAGLVVPLRRTTMQRIRGRVEGMKENAGRAGYQVVVAARGGAGIVGFRGGFGGGNGRIQPDGTFETAGLPPGSYTLQVVQFAQGPPVTVGRANVELGDTPLDNVVLYAGTPLEISGQIRTDAPGEWNVAGTRISLDRQGPTPGAPPVTVKPDGSFVMRRVGRDQVPVVVTPPPGTYVKSITVGGQEVSLTGLDLTASDAVAPMEIVLGTKPATVNGQAKEAAAGVVWLVGSNPNLRLVAPINERGGFSLGGLAPGEYRAVALEAAEMVGEMDADNQRKVQGKFEKVKLAEGENVTVTLAVVTQKELESAN